MEGTMKARTSLITGIIAFAAALLFHAPPARADFARDAALVQRGEISLEEAVGKAIAAGEDINSILVVATGVGLDLSRLASALLNSGVDANTIRAAMLNAGVEPARVGSVLAVAQAQFAATTAAAATVPITAPVVGATGAGAGGGGGASPF